MFSTLPPWVFGWSGHPGVALCLGSWASLQAGLIWLDGGLRLSPENTALNTQVFGPMPKRLFTAQKGGA
ncbi:MAG: hypothetical protein RQ750_00450 [Roseovarius sp.]|nr:hypothetical protein [Roseovarius sp.]